MMDRKTRFKSLTTEGLEQNMDHTTTITVGKGTSQCHRRKENIACLKNTLDMATST